MGARLPVRGYWTIADCTIGASAADARALLGVDEAADDLGEARVLHAGDDVLQAVRAHP